jgi:hypothetical protein
VDANGVIHGFLRLDRSFNRAPHRGGAGSKKAWPHANATFALCGAAKLASRTAILHGLGRREVFARAMMIVAYMPAARSKLRGRDKSRIVRLRRE